METVNSNEFEKNPSRNFIDIIDGLFEGVLYCEELTANQVETTVRLNLILAYPEMASSILPSNFSIYIEKSRKKPNFTEPDCSVEDLITDHKLIFEENNTITPKTIVFSVEGSDIRREYNISEGVMATSIISGSYEKKLFEILNAVIPSKKY